MPRAFAADHWHRDGGGGYDLTEPDGTVVGMVRKDIPKPGWNGIVTHKRGSESFDSIGSFHTMAAAKAAVVHTLKTDAEDED